MSATWNEAQQAAILAVLDRVIQHGEDARTVRDLLTGKRRAMGTEGGTETGAEAPWDGLTNEMQETYWRTHAVYTAQLERAKLARPSTEEKGNEP